MTSFGVILNRATMVCLPQSLYGLPVTRQVQESGAVLAAPDLVSYEPVSLDFGNEIGGCLRRLPNALSSSPTDPVPNQFVFGHGSRVGFEDLYQPASLQQSNSTLHSRLGQACPFRQVL